MADLTRPGSKNFDSDPSLSYQHKINLGLENNLLLWSIDANPVVKEYAQTEDLNPYLNWLYDVAGIYISFAFISKIKPLFFSMYI